MSDERPPAPAPRLPPVDGDAPLEELTRDRLSVFLYVTFLPEELLQLVKKLGITVRGYRPENLSDVERADLVADEVREVRGRRKQVLDSLRAALGRPALNDVSVVPAVATELANSAIEEAAMARFLWRVLADPDPAVRASALPALDRLVDAYYPKKGAPPPPPEREGVPAVAPSQAPLPAAERDAAVQKAEKRAARAERDREKAQAQVARLREQLREARAEAAAAAKLESAARRAAEAAKAKAGKAAAALDKSKGKGVAAALSQLRREHDRLQHGAQALQARVERLEAELAEKDAALARAAAVLAGAGPAAPAPAGPASPEGEAEAEEAPPTWLMPIFTREFYDSLRGWDRRIQRAAFKQAYLLSQDHRHPSLRALPLEGLPNLYRVRVATDVRLLYRRAEAATVELLSLIDREDLDRYIKQAKERG